MKIMYEDAVILVYHLDIMEKSVRDNFVRERGMKGFTLARKYKSILKTIEKTVMKNVDNQAATIDLNFKKDQEEMLKEFLTFYIKKIKEEHNKEQQAAGDKESTIDDHPAITPLQTVLYMLLIKESKAIGI